MGAFGLGAVLGGVYSTRHAQTGGPRLIRAAVLYMVAMLATSCANSLPAAVILLILVGFASIIFLTTGNSTIQIAAAAITGIVILAHAGVRTHLVARPGRARSAC